MNKEWLVGLYIMAIVNMVMLAGTGTLTYVVYKTLTNGQ